MVKEEDRFVDRLLSEALETLGLVSRAVGDLNRQLELIQQRIDSGELRRECETEMRRWLADNPEAVRTFRKKVMPILGRESASGDR